MENRSAEQQAIDYLTGKQKKVIDHMDEYQMYRFALDALKEKEARKTGCNCCCGDDALFWEDNENNTFVTRNGEMLVTVKDHTRRFKVKYCPNCGRRL